MGKTYGYTFWWISGIFVFLFASEDRFIRFHSLQSTLFFGSSNLLSAVILALLGGMSKIVNNGNKMFLTISFIFLLLVFAFIKDGLTELPAKFWFPTTPLFKYYQALHVDVSTPHWAKALFSWFVSRQQLEKIQVSPLINSKA